MKKFVSLLAAGTMALSMTAVTLAQESSSSSSAGTGSSASSTVSSAGSSASSAGSSVSSAASSRASSAGSSASVSSKRGRTPAHVALCRNLTGRAHAACVLANNPGRGNKKKAVQKAIIKKMPGKKVMPKMKQILERNGIKVEKKSNRLHQQEVKDERKAVKHKVQLKDSATTGSSSSSTN